MTRSHCSRSFRSSTLPVLIEMFALENQGVVYLSIVMKSCQKVSITLKWHVRHKSTQLLILALSYCFNQLQITDGYVNLASRCVFLFRLITKTTMVVTVCKGRRVGEGSVGPCISLKVITSTCKASVLQHVVYFTCHGDQDVYLFTLYSNSCCFFSNHSLPQLVVLRSSSVKYALKYDLYFSLLFQRLRNNVHLNKLMNYVLRYL